MKISAKLRAVLFIWYIAVPINLTALDPGVAIDHYRLRSWTSQHDASLADALTIAQTPDGYLWIGTSRGLKRFDGTNVLPWRWDDPETFAATRVQSLIKSRDGALWIGSTGVISRYKNRELHHYALQGQPPASITAISEDADGSIWLATPNQTTKVQYIRDEHLYPFVRTDQSASASTRAILSDRQRRQWMGSENGLCVWKQSVKQACISSVNVSALAEAPDGSIVVSDVAGRRLLMVRAADSAIHIVRSMPVRAVPSSTLFDRDGNLWVGTIGNGLLRIRGSAIQRLTESQGLSSNLISSLFEDAVGNLWIATDRGIDRLSNPIVSAIDLPQNLTAAVVLADADGRRLIGTINDGLFQVASRGESARSIRVGQNRTVIAIHRYRSGLLVGTTGGLFYLSGAGETPLLLADGAQADRVFSIVDTLDGVVWFADAKRGLLRLLNNRLEIFSTSERLRGGIRSLFRSGNGDLWVGSFGGDVITINRAGQIADKTPESLHLGSIYSITQDDSGSVWVGCQQGLARFRGTLWTLWGAAQGLPRGGLYALLADKRGIWSTSAEGLVHITWEQLNAAPDGSPALLLPVVIGPDDGVRLRSTPQMSNPGIDTYEPGFIWFPTEDGVSVLDERHLPGNASGVKPRIERFLVDGKNIETNNARTALQGRAFQFDFSSPSLTEEIPLYFRLENADPTWIQSGRDHRAFYGLLRPGTYTFTVRVGADGERISLPFTIKSRFVDTPYFYGLILIGILCVGSGAYQLRLAAVRNGLRLVYQERLRVSRDLHDSLLQGFTGVLYQLHAAVKEFDWNPSSSKESLTKALEQADASMREARQAISLMRLPALENQSLSGALREAGSKLVDGLETRYSCTIDPGVDQLPYMVQSNLFVVGRELIRNAVAHANATSISLSVSCGKGTKGTYVLIVEDDGIGFDPEVPAQPGHIGVKGVYERADALGASVKIDRSSTGGIRVQVVGKSPPIRRDAPAKHL